MNGIKNICSLISFLIIIGVLFNTCAPDRNPVVPLEQERPSFVEIDYPSNKISDYFGINVFDKQKMQKYLSIEVSRLRSTTSWKRLVIVEAIACDLSKDSDEPCII